MKWIQERKKKNALTVFYRTPSLLYLYQSHWPWTPPILARHYATTTFYYFYYYHSILRCSTKLLPRLKSQPKSLSKKRMVSPLDDLLDAKLKDKNQKWSFGIWRERERRKLPFRCLWFSVSFEPRAYRNESWLGIALPFSFSAMTCWVTVRLWIWLLIAT